jgi:hypothetical protein
MMEGQVNESRILSHIIIAKVESDFVSNVEFPFAFTLLKGKDQ